MTDCCVNILLASFNGEKFIAEQINSIIDQTYKSWQLYIRDDGSSDKTLSIINAYQNKDSRIHLITDKSGNLGSCQNFAALINYTKNKDGYTMFSDQDDVWLTSKIEDTLNEMLRLEKIYNKNSSLLVHTDLLFVDSYLKPIESKKEFQQVTLTNPAFSNVLCQNEVHGCTMMINKNLADVVSVIPAEAENHDYWIALVASAFGKRSYLNKKTIFYRQHSFNLSPKFNFNSFTQRFKRIFFEKKNFKDVELKLQMALIFKQLYYSQLSDYNKKIIDDFINLFKRKTLPLLIENIRNGIRRQTFSQTLLFYLTLFLSKKNARFNIMLLALVIVTSL